MQMKKDEGEDSELGDDDNDEGDNPVERGDMLNGEIHGRRRWRVAQCSPTTHCS
jgi:hypothetical protein